MTKSLLDKWLEGRPRVIRDLAHEFPPGTPLRARDGSVAYVVGYCEDGGVTMSSVPPGTDYDEAMASRFYVCKACLRDEPGEFRAFDHGVNGCRQKPEDVN